MLWLGNSVHSAGRAVRGALAQQLCALWQAEQFAVLWLLLLSIVIGNSAVIVALKLSKSRKSRTNFFIMHLALAGEQPCYSISR